MASFHMSKLYLPLVKTQALSHVKQHIRQLLVALNLPVTRNLKYDILTKKILQRLLDATSNCVDVGAHKGEILDLFLQFAPNGRHTAFEPIPHLNEALKNKYSGRVDIYPFALSNRSGSMLFNVVLNDIAYSGLQRREYKTAQPKIDAIEVEVRQLDEVLSARKAPITLLKIDVEGGELDVLKGAHEILLSDKPLIVFEFGKGASEFYGTMPHHVHELLHSHHYEIWTLEDFWKNRPPLTFEQLLSVYESGSDYYFVAKCIDKN